MVKEEYYSDWIWRNTEFDSSWAPPNLTFLVTQPILISETVHLSRYTSNGHDPPDTSLPAWLKGHFWLIKRKCADSSAVARSWFRRIIRATTVIPLPGSIYGLKKTRRSGKSIFAWVAHIQRTKGNYSERAPDIRTKWAGPICATYAYGFKWRGMINGWCLRS